MEPANSYRGLQVEGLDVKRFVSMNKHVNFTARVCSDGFCCFIDHKSALKKSYRVDVCLFSFWPRERNARELFELSQEELLEVVVRRGYDIDTACACESLELSLNVQEENLQIDIRCGCYSERPGFCRDYPEYMNAICTFAKYLNGPKGRYKRGISAIFVLGLSKEKHAGYSQWSIGLAKDIKGLEYLMIPVFWDSKQKHIVPRWSRLKQIFMCMKYQ